MRISGFGDGVSAAFAIAERLRRAHASVAPDEKGFVIDFTWFTAVPHSIETALAWADCLSYNEPRFKLLLLISVGNEDVSTLVEADVEVFRRARRAMSDRAVTLIDWLKANKDGIRSMAISMGSEGDYELIQGS